MGTNIHRVLWFGWVLLFRKLVVTALMGTNIHGVLVIDGYLYSRLYGIRQNLQQRMERHLALILDFWR